MLHAKSGYYRDILEIGAATFELLIKTPPFVDGNKRVAFFATDVFLRLNGYKFDVVATEAHQFLDQKTMETHLKTAGLTNVEYCNLSFGITCIHTGTKPVKGQQLDESTAHADLLASPFIRQTLNRELELMLIW